MSRAVRCFLAVCSVLGLGLVSGGVAEAAPAATKICYRSHLAGTGWQGWKCDGQFSGTAGENRAIEAVEIQIWGKGTWSASAHVRNESWQIPQYAGDGELIRVGTTGKALPMEMLSVGVGQFGGTLEGYAHVQNLGWMDPVRGYGIEIGTQGQALQLEALTLKILN